MSYRENRDSGPIPNRWLNCPRKSYKLIAEKFLAFKTPLGSHFNDKVPEANRFLPSMLFAYVKDMKIKLGLWIDLTNTSRFYNKKEIEDTGCKYVKLQCRGHGETPTTEQTQTFIKIVSKFISQNPLEAIGIHCTHGFNRTGFLIVSFMVEQLDCSVQAALTEFAKQRSPGIYKQDYLQELFRRYDDVDDTPQAPPRPAWCLENENDEDGSDNEEPQTEEAGNSHHKAHQNTSGKRKKSKRPETSHKKASFMPPVSGVEPFDDQPRLSEVQKKVQRFCDWEGTGFPGSQPVSMDVNNLHKLHTKPYRVSWKADGVRYMMLIDGEDKVYMLDRDNCVFRVSNLAFVHKNDLNRHLTNTLLDGEMVVDKVGGKEFPRYLCYDIIRFEDENVGKYSFFPDRLSYVEKEIVNPRHQAMAKGIINQRTQTFSVRLKQFWEVSCAHSLLGEKFAKSLSHEPDGLIFQPSKEPYVPGPCEDVLKWKPGHLNSVDFKLKIVTQGGEGMLPTKLGLLYVGKQDKPFASMKVTKDIKDLNGKIIECKFENNTWKFMRERTDKSYPNSANTAISVCESIKDPVTQERLLDYIAKHRFQDDMDDSNMMPPPKRTCR